LVNEIRRKEMPQKSFGSAAVVVLLVALSIIMFAVYFGVISGQQTHIDSDKIPVVKNITVVERYTGSGQAFTVVDETNTSYLTSEKAFIGMKENKNYTVTVYTYNNNSGYWISSYVGIPDLTVKKAVNTK